MSYNDMKESLRLLATHLETLGAFGDPKLNLLPAISQSSKDAQLGAAVLLIENLQQAILDQSRILNDSIQRYSTLVTSSTSIVTRTTPWIPNEVLIDIFGYLAEDGVHRLRPLLLADKRFHALALSTPSLWCNIHIEVDATFRESNDLSARYIQWCIENSQESLLNVSLDMTKTSSLRQQVVAQLNGVRYKMPELTDTIELAVDAIYKASWGNDTDHHYNTDHYYLDLVDTTEVLIQAVVGRGGVYMQRWKSFKFAPSTDSLYKEAFACKTLWLTFRYPTPNLETFTVSRPVSLQPLRLFDGCFPDLTAVRHFTLRDTHGFASANLSRHLLTTAVIHRDPSELNLEALSSCLSLQELTIVQLSGLPLSIPRDIPLPSLKRMTLEGDVSALANVTFQTPSLERLKLECGCVQEMPKVEAHSVVWAPTGRKFLDSMVKFVQCVLGRVKAMETLTLKCEPVDGLNVAVRGMVEKAFGTGDYSRVVKFVVGKGETDELCIKSGWIP